MATLVIRDRERCVHFCLVRFLYLPSWIKGIWKFLAVHRVWAAEVAARCQASTIFVLPCVNDTAVPVLPFEHVPSWPKAILIILKMRWCSPFLYGMWLPVAWSSMLCRKVEDSAYDMKLFNNYRNICGAGYCSCFFEEPCWMLGVCSPPLDALLHVFFWTGNQEGKNWMNENSTHSAKFSLWSEEPDQKAVKHRDLCPERCQS